MNIPLLKTSTYRKNRVDILAELSTKLNKFRRISEGRYLACCPIHDNKNPSFGITLKPNNVWVMHCLGCGANGLDACNALGIDPTLMYPSTDNPRYEKKTRSGFRVCSKSLQ